MSPISTLFLVLLGLHVVEGLLWVPRDALTLVRGWRRWHLSDRTGGFGNATHRVELLSPFPPLFERHVVPRLGATLTREQLAHAYDVKAIEARLAEFRASTLFLQALSNLAPFVIFGALAAFFFAPSGFERWPVLLATVAIVLVTTWVETYRVHKRLYPAKKADRAQKLVLLVLSFPAAARARAWLGRDVLAGFAPLAVASVLLPREAFVELAAYAWRHEANPTTAERAAIAAGDAAAREREQSARRELLAKAGVGIEELSKPPARTSPSARAHCPRCHAEYVDAVGPCPDCPGVDRREWAP